MIPTHQDAVMDSSQMVTHQQPMALPPLHARRAQALARAVTAPWATPTRQPLHGHAAADREHRLDHSSQLAQGRQRNTLADASSNDHNIGHGRRLLVCVESDWGIHLLHGM